MPMPTRPSKMALSDISLRLRTLSRSRERAAIARMTPAVVEAILDPWHSPSGPWRLAYQFTHELGHVIADIGVPTTSSNR